MRELIPLDFAVLGWPELVWLALVVAGLSLVAAPGRRRRGALVAAGLVALVGVIRCLAKEGEPTAWNRWLRPVVVAPLATAALVRIGVLRPRLVALAGSPARLAAAWVAALAGWSLLARPFGMGPASHAAEWMFLAFLGVALVALGQHAGGPLARALGRRVGPVRVWMLGAVAFLVLCVVGSPFAFGFVRGLATLFLIWVVYAILEQGREMQRYVVRRLVGAPVVLVLLMVLSFIIIRSAPGGPFLAEKSISPQQKEMLERHYGIDKPLPEQFRLYLIGFLWQGDLGVSMKQIGKYVNEIIRDHITVSAQLGLAALALAILVGVTAGLVAGMRQNSIFDYASMAGAMLGLSLPMFVVGPFLVLIFAMKLDWFRVAGWEEFPRDLILPAVTLSLPFAARVARLTRAGMLEIVNQDYIRTARAKGLSEPTIVMRHTLKGTLLPVVSFLGPAVAQLLTGSLVVEKIFAVPGLGTEFVNGALNRDYSLAMGLVVLFGTLLILFNLIVDVAYGFLDPRIRHG